MPPLPGFADAGSEHPIRNGTTGLADRLRLSEEDRKPYCRAEGDPFSVSRVRWARKRLPEAGSVKAPRRARIRITHDGRKVRVEPSPDRRGLPEEPPPVPTVGLSVHGKEGRQKAQGKPPRRPRKAHQRNCSRRPAGRPGTDRLRNSPRRRRSARRPSSGNLRRSSPRGWAPRKRARPSAGPGAKAPAASPNRRRRLHTSKTPAARSRSRETPEVRRHTRRPRFEERPVTTASASGEEAP